MSNYDAKTIEMLGEIVTKYTEFDLEDIVKVLPKLIIHLKTYKEMSGLEKKDYIIDFLKYIVDKTDGPGNDELWDPIIKRLIPGVVDLLIDVDDGKLKLKNKKCITKCLSMFSCK
tara:strand:- start:479 stop:823 length:345 start_codon:yes stop_codon:yes gene_type:complete